MRFFILTIAALALPAFAQENPPVTAWISSHAIRLATPVAGHGFDDMAPLKKVVGDARIVELGEATHGSREFFQLKHRMLEFLATEMGFTAVCPAEQVDCAGSVRRAAVCGEHHGGAQEPAGELRSSRCAIACYAS